MEGTPRRALFWQTHVILYITNGTGFHNHRRVPERWTNSAKPYFSVPDGQMHLRRSSGRILVV
jgi:hypothetical protein